jgi:hypothetical protein
MLGSTVPRKVSQAAQTAALMSSWLTSFGLGCRGEVVHAVSCGQCEPASQHAQVFGDGLELLFAVVDEALQG